MDDDDDDDDDDLLFHRSTTITVISTFEKSIVLITSYSRPTWSQPHGKSRSSARESIELCMSNGDACYVSQSYHIHREEVDFGDATATKVVCHGATLNRNPEILVLIQLEGAIRQGVISKV